MTTTDASTPASPSAPARSRRGRWFWLLAGVLLLLAGGLGACEGWGVWEERLARQALDEDHMDEARHHIDLALLVPPRRLSTLLLAARIRRLRGFYSEAEQYLLRCEQLDSTSEPVQVEWLLLRCQQGEVDELSPQLFAMVKQLHPQSPAILETLASMYLRQMRYLEAGMALNLWVELVPNSVRALDWRGWVEIQLDHREQGIRAYERLLELQPMRSDIRLRLAQVLIESNRHEQAVPHLEWLLRQKPNDPDVVAVLAPCRHQEGRSDEARALLDAALEKTPDHFDLLYQRGFLEVGLGNAAAAEPFLRKALRIKPHDKQARWNLCQSLRGQGRQQEYEQEQAIWDKEKNSQDRLTSLLRKYLAANPNDVDLACEAGKLLLEQGEEKRGLFWLNRALSINPHHVPSQQALAAYHERTNQEAKTKEQ